MNNIILGNLFAIFAMCSDSISSSQKTAKRVLLVQCASQVFYGLGSLVLGGYSAVAQSFVSILRNIAAIRKINNRIIEWTLVGLGVALGLFFNNLGLVGLLPVIANLEYSIAVFRFKDNERALKISYMICCLLYAVFSLAILNFVGVISNMVIVVTTIIFLIKGKKTKED